MNYVMILTLAGILIASGRYSSHGSIDAALFVLFCLLLGWLINPHQLKEPNDVRRKTFGEVLGFGIAWCLWMTRYLVKKLVNALSGRPVA